MRQVGKNRFVSVVVALVGAAVVAALYRFNQYTTSYNYYIVANMIGLFWAPMLSILFVIREDPAKFGFALCASKRVWVLIGVLFCGLVVVFVPVSRWSVYQDYYPLFRRYNEFAGLSRGVNPFTAAPAVMVYAEASYGMYMFCWEFFFRGYLLNGLYRSIGWSAVLVQAAAFGLLHHGKPASEVVASFGAGIVLGIIALNAKSFVPCFVLHWAAGLSFDVLVIAARPHSP